ncbi:iron permease [Lentinus brumalis]|uniref:Iron permease n=1 Tax=Lentinus brumalis TaxID=2498619 RepID=A0A371CUU1_9APHY|nr:iron permease [Polyporus brumalis]
MENDASSSPTRGFDFWMVYVSNLVIDMLSVLDLMAVSTALPTIVSHLNGTDFIWAGSAYTIASTAIVPLVGDLVSGFGRKPVLLAFVFIFALGSAISGAAQNMNMLIAGRAIQGFGGGGCLAVTEIVYADLVPLPERGKFQGIVVSVWAIGCAIGPPIGGAIANSGAWRWLFFLNLPLCGIAMVLTSVFLKVRAPKTSLKEKLRQMDWIGITIIVGSTVSLALAFTWGGLRFPWDSANVLAPMIIGAVGIGFFLVAERYWIKGATVPSHFFSSPTTLSGYMGTFFHGIISLAAIYYMPVYFQAVQNASAIGSGVDIFPITFTIPFSALATGISVKALKKYRPQNYIGWAITLIGFGAITRLDADSTRAQYICSQIPLGIGLGIVWVGTQFPILAPLPVSNNAHALAFFTFTRRFAQSWGIIIGGTILQNILLKELPPSYVATLPQGVQLAYAIIPDIRGLDPDLRREVQVAFANATQVIWKTMLGIAGVGILTCLPMREETLRESLDEQWGLKDKEAKGLESDSEKGLGSQDKIAEGGSTELKGAVAES